MLNSAVGLSRMKCSHVERSKTLPITSLWYIGWSLSRFYQLYVECRCIPKYLCFSIRSLEFQNSVLCPAKTYFSFVMCTQIISRVEGFHQILVHLLLYKCIHVTKHIWVSCSFVSLSTLTKQQVQMIHSHQSLQPSFVFRPQKYLQKLIANPAEIYIHRKHSKSYQK